MTHNLFSPTPEHFELTETMLGSEALEYIASELERAGTLGRRLRETLPLSSGRVATYLPEDVIPASITSFQDSCSANYRAMYSRSHDLAASLVRYHLASSRFSIAIFNTFAHLSAARIENGWIKKERPQFFAYETELYLYLSHRNLSETLIAKTLRHMGAYPGIIMFTARPPRYPIRRGYTISEQQVTNLVGQTKSIMIEAYDQDGYLFWTRDSSMQ